MMLRRYHKKAKPAVDYEKLTVEQLKELAKAKGIEHYSKLKRDELIAALKG